MNAIAVQSRSDPTAPAVRPFYTRLAALGFAFIALTGLVAMGFGLAAGSTGELLFVLPIVIIALLIAVALLRFGVWAQVLAALPKAVADLKGRQPGVHANRPRYGRIPLWPTLRGNQGLAGSEHVR